MFSGGRQEKTRAELGIEPGALVVSMASRLLYDKGVGEYMEAARLVGSRRSDVCFILAGEPDRGNPRSVKDKHLEAWANEGFVKQIGYHNDIAAIFAVSDVVVHPTYYQEGIPRVLIEAAAMGKPVVTTTMPGIVEIVENGVNGVSIPPRDEVELAAAIEGLLDHADLRRRYGIAGRRKAEAEYDDREIGDRYINVYRQAWRSTGARRRWANAKNRRFTPSPADSWTNPSSVSVSVIIPARNEETHIATALDSVLSQDHAGPMEVIIADGSNTPAMSEIVQRSYPDVLIVPNQEGYTPTGLNCAIRESSGEVIVRCDAQATLPSGYIRRVVETMNRTGAANVGGRQQATGTTLFSKAVALAMNSTLGSGGSLYRGGSTPGPTDTVYLGAWRRDTLECIGGFNPALIKNEDYELNWRLQQRDETVWYDPALVVEYRPRDNMQDLVKQYFGYGQWKLVVLALHPRSLQPRHMASPLLMLGFMASLAVGLTGSLWVALALPMLYLAVLVLMSAAIGLRRREAAAVLLPIVLAIMHLSWGIGFFLPPRKKPPR